MRWRARPRRSRREPHHGRVRRRGARRDRRGRRDRWVRPRRPAGARAAAGPARGPPSRARSLARGSRGREAAGALEPARYAALREDTDVRIARVRRALERRSAADTVERPAPPTRRPGTVPPWAVGVLIAATTIAVVVAGLAHSTTPAPSAVPGSNASDPLAFFEQRVREHPQDVAARLDLASRYLGAGRPRDALVQYAAVLRLDPTDAEAHARIGVIEYLAGRPKAALASVRRALETDPTYPEALFFEGAILLNGLDHPAAAIEAFQKYLASAPFGGERGRATQLIARAQRELRRAERAG